MERQVLPPLASSELEDLTSRTNVKNTTHLGGFVVHTNQDLAENGSLQGSNSNNNMTKKPMFHRLWRYLRSTLTGALTGNGKFHFKRENSKRSFCILTQMSHTNL